MRTGFVVSVFFSALAVSSCCRQARVTCRCRLPAAATHSKPRAPQKLKPYTVPLFEAFRMGMSLVEAKQAAMAYTSQGYWKRVFEEKRADKKEKVGDSAKSPRPEPVRPEPRRPEIHRLGMRLLALPWQGKQFPVFALRALLQLRFQAGILRKVELEASGFRPPDSFNLQSVQAYLKRLHPSGKLEINSNDDDGFKLEIESRKFEIEFRYEKSEGTLDVEVEYTP